ncbi:MAG: hypothetical protein ABIR35_01755 [Polaromonas sp.]
MKTSFKKTLVAVCVGAAVFAAAGTASANSLLFPYFTTVSGAQSVLSLSNTGAAPATQALHYVYNYGTACTHFNASGSLTANDILSHSIASPAAGGFGKVVGSDTSTPVYFPLANQTGFLVVSSKTVAATDALRGSMAIVDPASGLVVSYPGIDNAAPTDGAAGANGEGNFSGITDLNFPLTTLPSAIVSTSWYGVVVGDMGGAIGAGANWGPGVSFSNNGNVYNNDEVAYSGTTSKTITCAGSIVPADLATSAQAAAVGTNGGLVKVTGTPVPSVAPALGTATGAVLMKMQAVQAAVGAPFAGKKFLHREQAGL